MAYAMSTLVAMFLCMALVVMHVDSARLLLEAGNDTVGMTAETSATTENSAVKGTPPPAGEAVEFQAAPVSDTTTDAIVYNKDAVTTDPTTAEFAAESFDLTKQASTEEPVDEGTLVPPTDSSFAQEDSVRPGNLYNLNGEFPSFAADRHSESGTTTESFASQDQGILVGDNQRTLGSDSQDSFASQDQGILVGDNQRTLGSDSQDSFASENQGFLVGDSQRTSGLDATTSFASRDRGFLADTEGSAGGGTYDYRFDATKRDAAYPTDSNAGDSEFTLAEANPHFGSESGSPSTVDEPHFEFDDQDNTP